MYNDKLSIYYDDIYSEKNYKSECEFIKRFSPNRGELLDIGCGTMSHSIILSNDFKYIVATDMSSSMIDVGIKKITNLDIKNISPACGKLENIIKGGTYIFDTAISMFNVVNHINNISDLLIFFNTISRTLKKDGVFIFDCWNGIACTIEKPTPLSSKTISLGERQIITSTFTKTFLMSGISKMETHVKIYNGVELMDSFSYDLEQTLWTPSVLSDLLEISDIDVEKIVPYFRANDVSTEKDYRLTFICKKRKK
jgi:SAM-dependent methyltransferase